MVQVVVYAQSANNYSTASLWNTLVGGGGTAYTNPYNGNPGGTTFILDFSAYAVVFDASAGTGNVITVDGMRATNGSGTPAAGKLTCAITATRGITCPSIVGGSATNGFISTTGTSGTLTITGAITAGNTGSGVYHAATNVACVCAIVGSATGGSAAGACGVNNVGAGTLTINNGTSTSVTGGGNATAYGVYNPAGSGPATITGNVVASASCIGLYNGGTSTVTVNGSVTGGSGTSIYGIRNNSTGTITVNNGTNNAVIGGTGGTTAHGIFNNAAGQVFVTGNVVASAYGFGINNNSTGTMTITGNVTAAAVAGITNVAAATINVTGNVTGSSNTNGIAGINNSGNGAVTIAGNMIYTAYGPPIIGKSPTFTPGANQYITVGATNYPAQVAANNMAYGVVSGANTGTFTAPNTDGHTADASLVLNNAHFGAANGTAGTYDEVARNTDPGVANVLTGHDYKIANVNKTATLDLSTYTLISGVVAANNVRNGTARYSGGPNGNMTLPAVGKVVNDTSYGTSGTELTGTLNMSLYVLTSTITWPALDEVDGGVHFGPTGAEYTGTGMNATTLLSILGLNTGNLDTQLSSIQTSITNIGNNVSFNAIVPSPIIIPASGTAVNRFYAYTYDASFVPTDPDSNTIDVEIHDPTGTVVDSGTMTKDATGQYHYDYTVSSTDPEQALLVHFDYSMSAVSFEQARVTSAQKTTSALSAIKAKTDYLPSVAAGAAGGIALVGSVMGKSPATLATADVTGNLPANVIQWNTSTLPTIGTSTLDAAEVRTAIGLGSANLDTQLSALSGYVDCLPASWVVPAAVGAKMDFADSLNATGVADLKTKLGTIPASCAGSGTGNTLEGAVNRLYEYLPAK